MAKQGRREQELSKHNGGGGGAAMPAPAHRNCRLPGKTTQAMSTQATQGHQLEGQPQHQGHQLQGHQVQRHQLEDQPQPQGHLVDNRDGIGRKQVRKPTHMFFASLSLRNSSIQQKMITPFPISPEGFGLRSLQLEAGLHSPLQLPSQTCSPRSTRLSPRSLSPSHSGPSQTH